MPFWHPRCSFVCSLGLAYFFFCVQLSLLLYRKQLWCFCNAYVPCYHVLMPWVLVIHIYIIYLVFYAPPVCIFPLPSSTEALGDCLLPLNRHCWGTCCCVPGYCMHAHSISLYATNGVSLRASPVLTLGPLYFFFCSLGQAYFFFCALQCLLSYDG